MSIIVNTASNKLKIYTTSCDVESDDIVRLLFGSCFSHDKRGFVPGFKAWALDVILNYRLRAGVLPKR